METLEAIKARRSVREYEDKPMHKNLIERIVDCGRVAPTARNEEPWEFIAITDKKTLNEIADITDYGKFLKHSACTIIVCCKDTKYYLEDGCAATENMMIGAASLGIGSCWVAGDKKSYCEKILKCVKAPADYKLVSIIPLGYPAKKQNPTTKRPVEEVLHWEKF